jgi:hypothetical protein
MASRDGAHQSAGRVTTFEDGAARREYGLALSSAATTVLSARRVPQPGYLETPSAFLATVTAPGALSL